MKSKKDVKEIKDKLDSLFGDTPKQKGDIMAAFFEGLVATQERKKKELQEIVEEFAQLKREERKQFLLLLEEIRRLQPEKIEQLKVEVLNQPEFPKEIKVSNFPKYPEPLKEVGIKEPKWYRGLLERAITAPLLRGLGEIIARAIGRVHTVKIDGPTDPRDAIAVRLSDGNRFYKAVAGMVSAVGAAFPFATSAGHKKEALVDNEGHLQVDVLSDPGSSASTTPTIYNIEMTNANTEYSQALPDGTDRFSLQCHGNYDIRFAFESGKVATPTAPYGIVKAGMNYYEEGLNLTGKTIYVACGTAGQVAELIVWT